MIGFTDSVFVVCPPACQVKLVADPLAVKVVEFPEQIDVLPVMARVG